MLRRTSHGLGEFLHTYPGMAVRPAGAAGSRLVGEFRFAAQKDGRVRLEDAYELEIVVPSTFPRDVPVVFERGGRIPAKFHTNPDGDLCLGSPLRLLKLAHAAPTLLGFATRCLIPFLYSFTHFQRCGELPFGDLEHGPDGVLDDYCKLFGVTDRTLCMDLFSMLGLRKRHANKRPCPCGSGKRLGRCHNRVVNRFRPLQSRGRFKAEHAKLRPHATRTP